MSLMGCSKEEKDGIVKISPSTLFESDTKKLKPHLEMTTGCVKVEYKGDKKYMEYSLEILENGERRRGVGKAYEEIDGELDGEISVSVKMKDIEATEKNNKLKIIRAFMDENGYTSVGNSIEGFNREFSFGAKELQDTIEISDEEEAVVWAMRANGGNEEYSKSDNNILGEAKASDWALILKIRFLDNIDDRSLD